MQTWTVFLKGHANLEIEPIKNSTSKKRPNNLFCDIYISTSYIGLQNPPSLHASLILLKKLKKQKK